MSPLPGFLPAGLRARIEGSEALRRMLPNTGWIVADRLARMLVGMAVSAAVARYLGPDVFGRFNLAVAFAVLFGPLGSLGLDRVAVRELVRTPEERGEILGSALALRLGGGALGGLLAIGAMALLRRGDPEMLAMVAILSAGMLTQAFEVVDWWNQSRLRSSASVRAMSVGFVLAAVLRIVLILLHAPLVAFAWAWALELALASLGLAWSHRRGDRGAARWSVRGTRVRAFVRDGWPLLFANIMVVLYTRLDQVMLGQMTRTGELGLYAVAVRLVEIWYVLPSVIVTSVYPGIVELLERDPAAFDARMQKLYRGMVALSYAVALPTTLLAGPVVRLIFGEAYAGAAPMLAVLIWSLPFTSLGLARGAFLNSMNWSGVYLMTVTAGFAANLLLNLLLIPRLGGMGAVLASCAAYWVAAHGSCFLHPRLFHTGAMLTRALVLRGR